MPLNNDSFYTDAAFQSFFKSSTQSLVIKADSPKFTVLAVSDNFLQLVHMHRHEILGKSLFDVFPGNATDPTGQNSVISSFLRVIEDARADELPVFEYEIFVQEKEMYETHNWTNLNQPVFDADGKVVYIINTTTNITEQVRQQKALKESGQREQSLSAANEQLLTANEKLIEMQNELLQSYEFSSQLRRIYETITSTTPDLMYVFGLDYRFTYANNALLTMWGKTWDNAVGNSLLQNGYEPWHAEMHEREIDQVVLTKQPVRGEVSFPHAVLGKRVYDYILSPVINEQGEVEAIAGTTRDITERKRDELRKNDFIGMVSHELKTPLTALNAYLQLLQRNAEKGGDGMALNALNQSLKQIKRMTTIINGFLNVSRLESGKIKIDAHRFNMADLVLESESENLPLYSHHQIFFAPVEEIFVIGDRDKIGQVINNFISNAVKYSAPASIIQVACVAINGFAVVSVKDEGIGIEQKEIEKLFQRYYRVEGNNNIAGFGIGLYLCYEIVERHNGKIWVESEIGKGSIFYFSLPITANK